MENINRYIISHFIEQFGFEIEDDGNFGAYIDESQSPSNDYIITTSSLDEVPF